MAIPNEPLTRAEQYLNKIATGSGNTPDEPLTRIEMYLAEIAKNEGGGGSGGGGAVYATFTNEKDVWSCDKTFDELKAAYDAGNIIIGVVYHQFSFHAPILYIMNVYTNGSGAALGGIISALEYNAGTNKMNCICGSLYLVDDNTIDGALYLERLESAR